MKWFLDLKIKHKLLLAFGLLIALLVALSAFTGVQVFRVNRIYRDLISASVGRQSSSAKAISDMNRLRYINLSKGYLGDVRVNEADIKALCDRYDANVTLFLEHLNDYRDHTTQERNLSEAEKRERLDILDDILSTFTTDYQRITLDLDNALYRGDTEDIHLLISSAIPVGDYLTGRLEMLYDLVSTTVEEISDETAARTQQALWTMFSIAALFIAFSVFISLLMTRMIEDPIAHMEHAMEEISGGNLQYPIRSERHDELGMLANQIGSMVDSIAEMNKVMTVMGHLDSMVIVTDLECRLIYINQSTADAFGLDINDYKGKDCHAALRYNAHPCPVCQLPLLLPDKDSFPSREFEFLYDDVLDAWIGGKAAIIRWVDGSMAYLQSLKNETERKKNQEQLSEALEVAESASVAKSLFLANMSHELRTPLNAVIGLADLLTDDGRLPEDVQDNLHKISSAGNTLLSIVNDILDISKIESGNFALTPVEYHVASLLNDTVTLVTSRVREKLITFRLEISDDLPSKLFGDDLRVRQIFNNLLSNAIKYTHTGSVTLGVRCERAYPGESAGGNDGEGRVESGNGGGSDSGGVWVDITVTDTGIGIRREDFEKLFTDYNQVDALATRKIEGTGLGLPITKRLVESMGGDITVESEYGVGSTFRARILQGYVTDEPIGPVVGENLRQFRYNENKRHFVSALVRADLSWAKVLVVDDLQANLDVAAGLMRKYRMQVDCVLSGQAAIDRIRLGKPAYHAIFMDHMMPDMDGIEAADRIRGLDSDYARTIPIIALTANAVVGAEDLFYEHSFQAFITKPIDIMRLDSVIQQWVKKPASGLPAGDGPLQPTDGDEGEMSGDAIALPTPDTEIAEIPEDGDDAGPVIDIPGINIEKGLSNCAGDRKIYLSILRSYIADISSVFPKVREVTEDTLSAYRVAVHGIKGSSATIGAEHVSAAAAHLEELAKGGDLTGILAENEAMLRDTEYLVTSIRSWFDRQAGDLAKPTVSAPDPALLDRLRRLCEEFDVDGITEVMDKLDSAYYERDGDLVAWLKDKVETMDYDQAAERIAEHESRQKYAYVNAMQLFQDRRYPPEASRRRIIFVDDNLPSLTQGMSILKTFYRVYPASSAEKLFELLETVIPDLILLDIEMPGTDGYDTAKKLKTDPRFFDVPIIFLTAKSDEDSELEGFNLGAADYISKPFSGPILLKRIEKELLIARQRKDLLTNQANLKDYAENLDQKIHEKTEEVFHLQNAILSTVADLVEFRDELTGGHVARTRLYLKALIDEMADKGIYTEEVSGWNMDFFLASAQLHDVGKIAIPDLILNKPDKLTPEEFEIMKTHVTVGVDAIEKIISKTDEEAFLRHTLYIAGTHHERWDGTGYPIGLKGLNIPLEGRLMAIADVYDALISDRSYKKAYSHEEACRVIIDGAGSHFDPLLIEVFRGVSDEFARISREIED